MLENVNDGGTSQLGCIVGNIPFVSRGQLILSYLVVLLQAIKMT